MSLDLLVGLIVLQQFQRRFILGIDSRHSQWQMMVTIKVINEILENIDVVPNESWKAVHYQFNYFTVDWSAMVFCVCQVLLLLEKQYGLTDPRLNISKLTANFKNYIHLRTK